MSQRGRPKKQKVKEEDEETCLDEISKVHQKKQMAGGNVHYLVQFKGRESEDQWEWRSQKQLASNPSFKKELKRFVAGSKQRKNQQLEKTQKIVEQSVQKKVDSKLIKKLVMDKLIQQKLKTPPVQQQSLDKFVNKSHIKPKVEQTIVQAKIQNPKSNRKKSLDQFSKVLGPKNNEISKQKQQTQQQIQNSKQQTHKQKQQTVKQKQQIFKQKQQMQIKINTAWMQKIKSINKIKGYELRNGKMMYDVQAWDKNGQTIFIPAIPSETVMMFDEVKLATFLQDCLIRGMIETNNRNVEKKIK